MHELCSNCISYFFYSFHLSSVNTLIIIGAGLYILLICKLYLLFVLMICFFSYFTFLCNCCNWSHIMLGIDVLITLQLSWLNGLSFIILAHILNTNMIFSEISFSTYVSCPSPMIDLLKINLNSETHKIHRKMSTSLLIMNLQ